MNTLHLTLPTYASNALITVDGKRVVPNVVGGKGACVDYSTERDVVSLGVQSLPHELTEKFWWLWAFLYYIISICGILNTFIPREKYVFDYQVDVPLNGETALNLIMNAKTDGGRAFEVAGGAVNEERANAFTYLKIVKRRAWILRIAKIASWIAIAVITTIVIIYF